MRLALVLTVTTSFLLKADCIDGVRRLSAAEKQYLDQTYQRLVAALPAAPAGWEMSPPPAAPGSPALCTDTPQGGFAITATAIYRWSKAPSFGQTPEGQEIKKLDDEISQISRLPPAVSKERGDRMTACNEFRIRAMEAEKAGNKEEGQRLWKERNACLDKSEQVARDYAASVARQLAPLKARRDELQKKMGGYSNEVRVSLAANEAYPQRPSSDETEQVIGAERLPKAPGLRVHGVRLRLRGFPEHRDTILTAVDKAKLQSLLR